MPVAVDFYERAFGAVEQGERLVAPDGAQVAVLDILGTPVGLATEAPRLGTPSPETVGATTVRISIHVGDPDALQARAAAAGATQMFRSPTSPTGCARAVSSIRSAITG